MTIIDELLSEHRHVRAVISFFKDEIDKFEKAEPVEYEILHGTITYCRDYLDQWHHVREDMMFAAISSRDPDKAASLSEIADQHAHLARSTSALSLVFRDVRERGAVYLRDELVNQARALATSYERHLDWEEARFFPAAQVILTESDWEVLATRTVGPVDPLASYPVEENYRTLFSILAERAPRGPAG